MHIPPHQQAGAQASCFAVCAHFSLLRPGQRSFVLHVPANLPMDAAAPLLCAGITVYSPLKHYNLDKPGLKIGVVGLGGLGHMVRRTADPFLFSTLTCFSRIQVSAYPVLTHRQKSVIIGRSSRCTAEYIPPHGSPVVLNMSASNEDYK